MESLEKKSENNKSRSSDIGLVIAGTTAGISAIGLGCGLATMLAPYTCPEMNYPGMISDITRNLAYSAMSVLPFILSAGYLLNALKEEEDTPETTTTTTTAMPYMGA